MDYDNKIEECKHKLKIIEQEYAMTMGRIKQLEELKEESLKKKKEKKDKE